jgi:crotonobetainyl-CoA:carnitine CoA-transferase CaiB-like acyl-CoA transferase
MAELGAEIVKIEQAPYGDPSRQFAFQRDGRSAYFVQQNRGKRSLCVDFSKTESLDLLRELARSTDVVVENYGPGVMEKRGMDYASLSKINPRLIMASISAFGRSGPLSHKVGYDFIAQAFSGLMHMTGDPDGPPMFVGMGIGDQTSGVHAFSAIGYALFHRERTGVGQYIDIAMVDTLYHMHEINIQVWSTTKGEYVPRRMGSQHELVSPCGSFRGPQGYIVILVLERQWPSMARAMGQPELIEDPRFVTMRDRAKNRFELARIVEAWMQSQPSDEAVLKILEAHRVAAAPVMTVIDSVNHPHYKARNMIRTVPDPILGQVMIPGFPLKFSAFPKELEITAPLLGQHGEEILRDRLAMSEADIARLRNQGVLYSENK